MGMKGDTENMKHVWQIFLFLAVLEPSEKEKSARHDGSGKLSYRLREKAGYGNRRRNVSCGLFL